VLEAAAGAVDVDQHGAVNDLEPERQRHDIGSILAVQAETDRVAALQDVDHGLDVGDLAVASAHSALSCS